MPNYMVAKGRTLIFGAVAHSHPEIHPEWYVNRDSGLANRLKAKDLIETDKPCTGQTPKPEAKTDVDIAPELVDENNRLSMENKLLADSNRELAAAIEEVKGQIEGRDVALGKLAAECDHYRKTMETMKKEHEESCDDLSKQIETLNRELDEERATAPSAAGKKSKTKMEPIGAN
jgi:hypothetical protein